MLIKRIFEIGVLTALSEPSAPPFDGAGSGTIVKPANDVFNRDLFGSILLPSREVKVWCPPGYDTSTQHYPVLYCHDGQNAMEDSTSWTGHSWRLGVALTRLLERGEIERPPIVVMIPNDSGGVAGLRRRHMEYGDSPWAHMYVDYVAKELKPMIDSEFRTLSGPEHTSAMGTSLGGQASFLSLWRHPDVFGNVACLSPAFQGQLLADVALNAQRLRDIYPTPRIYIDNGGDTEETTVPLFALEDHLLNWNPGYWWLDTQLQPGVDLMCQLLDRHEVGYRFHKEAGGRHNERAWSLRIEQPMLHLYGSKR